MRAIRTTLLLTAICFFPVMVTAQESVAVRTSAALTRVAPSLFYWQGRAATTQMRNAAAARFGAKRYVVVGMVDTAGYAADVRAEYEGFFFTDSPITINGEKLDVRAYGFGFSG